MREYGVKSEGNAAGASAATLAELAQLVAAGELEVPIAATYPLDQVREAYARLAKAMSAARSSCSCRHFIIPNGPVATPQPQR